MLHKLEKPYNKFKKNIQLIGKLNVELDEEVNKQIDNIRANYNKITELYKIHFLVYPDFFIPSMQEIRKIVNESNEAIEVSYQTNLEKSVKAIDDIFQKELNFINGKLKSTKPEVKPDGLQFMLLTQRKETQKKLKELDT